MRTRSLLALFVLTFASAAHGEKAPATPALPPPPLSLSVSAEGATWKVRIENTGDVPIRIAADARLLTFEITAPAGTIDPKTKKPPKMVECKLPDFPVTDEGHELVVPGKRTWTVNVDPFLYCFGANIAALVKDASIKPHFGWALGKAKKPAAPFVASPVGAAIGKYDPVKQIDADAFALGEKLAPEAPAATPKGMWLSTSATLDVARGNEISITVTLANDGEKSQTLLFRPETIDFKVSGPGGSVGCKSTRPIDSPIRELYSSIGVKGRMSQTLLLTAVCPADTFDTVGVYRVTAKYDTTNASARSLGMKTWDDSVESTTPTLLRVRSSKGTELVHPVLDAPPGAVDAADAGADSGKR